jgi:hypothetical protein
MPDLSLLDRLAENIQLHANAKQVYGDPIERDGTTIIPVARVQWGTAEFRPYRSAGDVAIVVGAAVAGLVVGLLVARQS